MLCCSVGLRVASFAGNRQIDIFAAGMARLTIKGGMDADQWESCLLVHLTHRRVVRPAHRGMTSVACVAELVGVDVFVTRDTLGGSFIEYQRGMASSAGDGLMLSVQRKRRPGVVKLDLRKTDFPGLDRVALLAVQGKARPMRITTGLSHGITWGKRSLQYQNCHSNWSQFERVHQCSLADFPQILIHTIWWCRAPNHRDNQYIP